MFAVLAFLRWSGMAEGTLDDLEITLADLGWKSVPNCRCAVLISRWNVTGLGLHSNEP